VLIFNYLQNCILRGHKTGGYGVQSANGAGSAGPMITASITDDCGVVTNLQYQINYYDDEICSVYACYQDLHVNDGIIDVMSPDEYRAGERLSSDCLLPPGRDIDFHAGESIELMQGFSVEPFTAFNAYIQGCNVQTLREGQIEILETILQDSGLRIDPNILESQKE